VILLLDTNILIYLIKNHPPQVAERIDTLAPNDLWIACHALALDATLVSHNMSEFARIDGLRLEDWASS
jgi:predicted nucleic acid-binding protein